ncbi:metallophosphoesterase [Lacticaseibacillus parakribbianus]|uniref:metallophosphoesterase n=1 Tax=Lacticaseibacillus parakribbianus TaxID=2970927 RepID=UPI0021CAE835|nr:metallophosphoesterase [Lacticaseibacillus parakribbianus]
MRYVIADLHFGHVATIEADRRPFSDVQAMDAALIANWRRVVRPVDIVYILGDFTLKDAAYAQTILAQLPGRKVMVRGNHDRFLADCGVASEQFEQITQLISFKENHLRYQLCHYPVLDYPGMWHHQRLLYGHVHGERRSYFRRVLTPNAVNVGASEIDYTPLSVAQVEDRITAQWRAKLLELGALSEALVGRPMTRQSCPEKVESLNQACCRAVVVALAAELLENVGCRLAAAKRDDGLRQLASVVLDAIPAPELREAQRRVSQRHPDQSGWWEQQS